MNLQNIIRKTESVVAVVCSALLGRWCIFCGILKSIEPLVQSLRMRWPSLHRGNHALSALAKLGFVLGLIFLQNSVKASPPICSKYPLGLVNGIGQNWNALGEKTLLVILHPLQLGSLLRYHVEELILDGENTTRSTTSDSEPVNKPTGSKTAAEIQDIFEKCEPTIMILAFIAGYACYGWWNEHKRNRPNESSSPTATAKSPVTPTNPKI